ncbi:hypothetical protein JCM10212_004089 [Sporobolomyces blumeae]
MLPLRTLANHTRATMSKQPTSASSTLRHRQPLSTSSRSRSPSPPPSSHSHSHSHKHGHSHSHAEETAALDSAFSSLRNPSSLDPGSRITLVGLFANVGLTALKGVAGYVLASSALLADAAHSGSDLVADVVTLASYRVSRWNPTDKYPYGYGKFESLGSLVVSFLLFATAAGIGLHSYHHLLVSLSTLPQIPPDLLASLDFLPHGHSHGPAVGGDSVGGDVIDAAHEGLVDARAMWFAAGSIAVKEWLYRATLKVAKETHSNVILANAYHHRSDSLGSLVALVAIGAARVGFPMLDPIGGLVVGGMIAKQGWDVGKEAIGELVDKLGDPTLPPQIYDLVASLRSPDLPDLPPFSLMGTASSPHVARPPSSTRAADVGSGTASTSSALQPSLSPSGPTLDTRGERDLTSKDQREAAGGRGRSGLDDDDYGSASLPILSIRSIRLFASGPSLLIDVELVLPSRTTMRQVDDVQRVVKSRVKALVGDKRCREVVVRVRSQEEEDEHEHEREHAAEDGRRDEDVAR